MQAGAFGRIGADVFALSGQVADFREGGMAVDFFVCSRAVPQRAKSRPDHGQPPERCGIMGRNGRPAPSPDRNRRERTCPFRCFAWAAVLGTVDLFAADLQGRSRGRSECFRQPQPPPGTTLAPRRRCSRLCCVYAALPNHPGRRACRGGCHSELK